MGKGIICNKCKEKFHDQLSLDKYISTVHHIEKYCICNECKQTFDDPLSLDEHISAVHQVEKELL